jgi:hypothetical protein
MRTPLNEDGNTSLTDAEREALDILSDGFGEVAGRIEKADHRALKKIGLLSAVTGGFFNAEDRSRCLANEYRTCAWLLLEFLEKVVAFREPDESGGFRQQLDEMERKGWEILVRVLTARASKLASLIHQVAATNSAPLVATALSDLAEVVSAADDKYKVTSGAVTAVLGASASIQSEAIAGRVVQLTNDLRRDVERPVAQCCDILRRAGSANEAAHYERLFLPS